MMAKELLDSIPVVEELFDLTVKDMLDLIVNELRGSIIREALRFRKFRVVPSSDVRTPL